MLIHPTANSYEIGTALFHAESATNSDTTTDTGTQVFLSVDKVESRYTSNLLLWGEMITFLTGAMIRLSCDNNVHLLCVYLINKDS